MNMLKIIRERQSSRVPFDRTRVIPPDHMRQILEAARWTPTAHNMQNFEIVVIDDAKLLDAIANIRSEVSEVFVRKITSSSRSRRTSCVERRSASWG